MSLALSCRIIASVNASRSALPRLVCSSADQHPDVLGTRKTCVGGSIVAAAIPREARCPSVGGAGEQVRMEIATFVDVDRSGWGALRYRLSCLWLVPFGKGVGDSDDIC